MNYLSLSSARSVVVLGMVPITQAWYEAVPWPMSWASNHGFTFFRLHRRQLRSGYRPPSSHERLPHCGWTPSGAEGWQQTKARVANAHPGVPGWRESSPIHPATPSWQQQ